MTKAKPEAGLALNLTKASQTKENLIREARALLMIEEAKNEKACLDAVNKALREHGYEMDVKSQIIFRKTPPSRS